ncbi:class I SAM-dependent methyltransferase [Azoarcus olearius]|uniref:class I SAM-dependent methyltransferase n=1 Tax=Azoarcus sp. (strain BH72) TaxID=418699 RepID=UPI001F238810|nr:class I SAM-dependent methyltransferase [Azoarcus olearius]
MPLLPVLAALPPELKALIAQAGGAVFAILAARSGVFPAGLWSFVMCQATGAALLAVMLHSARWWVPIHLVFLPALVAARGLGLPPWLYLAVFLVLLAFYWTSFRTQAPLFLTNRRTVAAVAAILPATPLSLLDVGSGTGSLVRPLARLRPDSRFCGVETAPGPWLLGRLLGARLHNLEWLRGDLFALPWGDYDVVYAFLSPAPMPEVWRKACAELRPGALLLSNSFAVPGRKADLAVEIGDARGTVVYGYRIRPREAAN